MASSPKKFPAELDHPPAAFMHQPASPRFPSPATPTAGAQRRIAIAVDLSDESAYAVKWAVQNYLRPGDAVILLHVRPTSVLYGADWGALHLPINDQEAIKKLEEEDQGRSQELITRTDQGLLWPSNGSVTEEDQESQKKMEDDFDSFTTTKANELSKPLVEGGVPFKIHIVKDHDMKERLCLEVERLGLSAVIIGSRGFGASSRQASKSRLGRVSDYCVHHCVCPVVVVRYPDEKDGGCSVNGDRSVKGVEKRGSQELEPVPEEETEFHDASDKA
ncbi:hypothetical protein LIER_22228 [Lithospermum erythrorhizon]|uniref:UspA domain-containing protein n=1 Tax=Lithospermum erythrorhizon TaxID=34254 RepID=A0AAV3QT43_LITER